MAWVTSVRTTNTSSSIWGGGARRRRCGQLPSVGCFQGRAGQVSSWQCSHKGTKTPSSASTLKLHLWVKFLLDQTTFLQLFEHPPEGGKFHRDMEKKRFIFFLNCSTLHGEMPSSQYILKLGSSKPLLIQSLGSGQGWELQWCSRAP